MHMAVLVLLLLLGVVVEPVLTPRSVLRLSLQAEALIHVGDVDQKSRSRVADLADVGDLGQLES
jgi:hypothetical protein